MTNKTELLPCPFCAGEAIFVKTSTGSFVQCKDCMTNRPTMHKWNTRAPANKTEMVSVRERLTEIANRDSAVSVTVRADDLRALLAAPAEDVRPTCREDHRCQQAIDYGVEGMAHCQDGLCAMPDVRAVVDEPVAEVVTIKRQSLPMMVNGVYHSSITSDEKVAMFDVDLPNGTKLYRHPQRPVVMPERKPDAYRVSVGLIPYHEGWNACLDEFKRLNP